VTKPHDRHHIDQEINNQVDDHTVGHWPDPSIGQTTDAEFFCVDH